MKQGWAALVVGFIFAIGLGISGMTQPEKVFGFLNLFGGWDPSLMFVMGGAVGVHMLTYRLVRRRKTPVLSHEWHVPTKKTITPALIIGSLLFGVGWGLGGFCPGPALTSLASFDGRPFLFVMNMLIGMYAFRMIDRKLKIAR